MSSSEYFRIDKAPDLTVTPEWRKAFANVAKLEMDKCSTDTEYMLRNYVRIKTESGARKLTEEEVMKALKAHGTIDVPCEVLVDEPKRLEP